MLEACRRLPMHDFILAVLSTLIIVYFWWPDVAPKQRVQLNRGNGQQQIIDLTVGSESWQRVIEARDRWMSSGIERGLLINEWRLEIAEFYRQQSESAVAKLNRSSGAGAESRDRFTDEVDPAGQIANAAVSLLANGSVARWSRRKSLLESRGDAFQEIKMQRERMSESVASSGPNIRSAPIVLGPIYQSGKQSGAFAYALVSGLGSGLLFVLAAFRWPSLRITRFDQARSEGGNDPFAQEPFDAGDATPCSDFSIDLPSDWVKVAQSPAVLIRRISLVTLLIAAVCSVIA